MPDRVFDANHLRPEGRQPLGGSGAGKLAREVADAKRREGVCHERLTVTKVGELRRKAVVVPRQRGWLVGGLGQFVLRDSSGSDGLLRWSVFPGETTR